MGHGSPEHLVDTGHALARLLQARLAQGVHALLGGDLAQLLLRDLGLDGLGHLLGHLHQFKEAHPPLVAETVALRAALGLVEVQAVELAFAEAGAEQVLAVMLDRCFALGAESAGEPLGEHHGQGRGEDVGGDADVHHAADRGR